ncbi:YitT family protein [Mycoplasma sp. P36-A1]|uniref:YitT family protein n=1 Tax=Mycoplasma sp. P36-A1 TaxID=3252900 RepID=UPI003C2AEC5F
MKTIFNMKNFYVLLGIVCVALSVNGFALANNLGEGGITGVTMLLYYTLNIPTAYSNFILNGILIIIGFKLLDKKLIYRTIVTVILTSVFLDLTTGIAFKLENSLIASIFAGLLMGAGIGFIYKGESTGASSPLVGKFAEKYLHINKSTTVLFMDIIVIIPSIFIIGLENSLLTLVSVYIGAKAIAFIVEGAQPSKSIMVISSQYKEIAQNIIDHTNKSVTVLDGTGYYSNSNYKMLYTVVEYEQMVDVIDAVRSIDPEAFMSVTNTSDVFGSNFAHLQDYRIKKSKHLQH